MGYHSRASGRGEASLRTHQGRKHSRGWQGAEETQESFPKEVMALHGFRDSLRPRSRAPAAHPHSSTAPQVAAPLSALPAFPGLSVPFYEMGVPPLFCTPPQLSGSRMG